MYSLGHFLLLFLPLTGLQVEKRIDLLVFRLRIIELQDAGIDCMAGTWSCPA